MNWFKKSNLNIQLTPAELNWAQWAIDPMYDYWCTEDGAWERDGNIYNENQLPILSNNNLTLSPIQEINEDLIYRIEIQAQDVSRTDSSSVQQESARSRAAKSLAKKITRLI